MFKKIIAASAALIMCLSVSGCGSKKSSSQSSETGLPSDIVISENGVSQVFEPEEGAEDYDLGSYRYSKSGIKLYYDEAEVSTELMLELEKYFTCFQNRDYDTYKDMLYPSYAKYFEEFLQRDYGYGMETSFEGHCTDLRNNMITEITGHYPDEMDEETGSNEYTGDFTITRIRGEALELSEGETADSRIQNFLSYLDEVFQRDYYNELKNDADELDYFTFYIMAQGEDGNEHLIVSTFDILFAKKDGKYYTFG